MSSPFSFVRSAFTLLSSSINSKDPNRGRCFWCFTYLQISEASRFYKPRRKTLGASWGDWGLCHGWLLMRMRMRERKVRGRGGSSLSSGVAEVEGSRKWIFSLQPCPPHPQDSGVARGGGHMARLIVCWWEAHRPHRLIIGIVRRPGGSSLPLP